MATLTHQESATAEYLELSPKTRRTFISIIVAGVVLLGIGLIIAAMNKGGGHEAAGAVHGAAHAAGPEAGAGAAHHEGSPVWLKRLLVSLWHNNVFFVGVSAIGTFFVALQYVAYAGWSVVIKRLNEAMSVWLIPGLIIFLVVFFAGRHDLFHWTHDGIMDPKAENYDAIIAGKSGFLNTPFYLIRMVVYLGIWWFFTERLRKLSLAEDLNGGTEYFHKSINVAALFLVLYAVTSSMSAWDWVMSVDVHWFSTMFGWYVFASWWVSGIAVTTLTAIYLKQAGYLKFVNANHLHDLGKFMFGFSIFWTYVWFSQFMLIWYANLPEEAVYYNQRLGGFNGAYTWIFFFNLVINFAFPFLVLMRRDAKRQMIMLKIVSIAILIGHWSDFYLMLMPATMKGENGFVIEIGVALIFLGSFLLLFTKRLAQASLVPVNHPFLDESVHHTT
ncbi:quinol:cytochrome C oxidoreductase [Hymenobacter cellulosilyticus]|uniref:Quinol:cytochrome C oxidoreductase n=1 Tax=Hymenobacter cellulosilyticus TaxID=2932248 RepID=A0A8T9Q3C3_9BACT|nr:quinol:cytochrome C oxidoreductase [Hymenobacter cellulosilyticus]UOQ72044.1 quinol:cytochrome C oxidoreductase [Hymenobacter cellulosilyticus]